MKKTKRMKGSSSERNRMKTTRPNRSKRNRRPIRNYPLERRWFTAGMKRSKITNTLSDLQ